MAKPIAETPILLGKDAKRFICEIKCNEQKPKDMAVIQRIQSSKQKLIALVQKYNGR